MPFLTSKEFTLVPAPPSNRWAWYAAWGKLRSQFTAACLFAMLFGMTLRTECAEPPSWSNEQLEFFEAKIRPLLVQHCYECHSVEATKLQAGLLVDSRASLLKGGDSGEAIVPKDADASLLYQAVLYESYEMPPKGKLPETDIANLHKWIEMGAPWPEEEAPSSVRQPAPFDLESRVASHWVWNPLTNPSRPKVQNEAWPKSELDYFILQGLEGAGMKAPSTADRHTLLRRLYLDITGLPPTEQQWRTFMEDPSDDAIARVVDQLLASPNFGERWGRHWLDLIRYAESHGHEFDDDIPNAFQYRDYIVRAFNADVPYDQLVREHIAGDLLPNPRLHPTRHYNESILGTGFWFLGEWVHSPVDIRKDEADRFDNMLDVMSKTFLGVTVACARCHDHKFDAISSADYYSLSGFLQSSDYRQVPFESMEANREVAKKLEETDRRYRMQLDSLLSEAGLKPPTAPAASPSVENLVVDYRTLDDEAFRQDGFIFGSKPVPPGTLLLRPDGKVEVNVAHAARSDSFWNGLKSITEGAVQNHSRLESLPRAGRTLLSPTFELKHGDVYCLVRGSGYIVACIDSHRLVAGPLHGETIREFANENGWVHLNLNRYVGHRLHLEFLPAVNSDLAIEAVVDTRGGQGIDSIRQDIETQQGPFREYATRVTEFLNGSQSLHRTVFADFESGSYGAWKVEGQAFGDSPQTRSTIADYQGDVQPEGAYFVNSHNVRKGPADTAAGDALTGKLTSPIFTIDCDAMEFLVGGGAHEGKTCVNLLVEDQVVLSATGANNNRMERRRWDVRPWKGKKAKIQVVDDHQGGWGNIGVDDFAFLSTVPSQPPNARAAELIAAWKQDRERWKQQVVLTSRLAPAMIDVGSEDDHILIRGNSAKPGKREPRHFLTAISGSNPMPIASGSGRLELADAINDPKNPLASRVIVNRVFHYLMGRGIVATVDDFGVLGQRPTHPELLDHLASRFLADGRSIKQLIRYIVLSRTYQMSSQVDPVASQQDPNNLLWHYRPPKRLEGEVIRDSLLQLSGKLDTTPFGPPVPIHLTPFMDGRGKPSVNGPLDGNGRRSIYVAVRRNFVSPFMLAFDTPIPFSTMGRRNVSNVPAQALILMNDPFVVAQANAWADRVLLESGDPVERIRRLYIMAFARQPLASEIESALQFLQPIHDRSRWTELAHILVNTKEFIFVR